MGKCFKGRSSESPRTLTNSREILRRFDFRNGALRHAAPTLRSAAGDGPPAGVKRSQRSSFKFISGLVSAFSAVNGTRENGGKGGDEIGRRVMRRRSRFSTAR